MALTYVVGDATKPTGSGVKILAHVCNDKGGWGKGFVRAISARWAKPEKEYRAWFKGSDSDFSLGKVQFVEVRDNELFVANMVAQAGYASLANPCPLDYDSLRTCLERVNEEALSMAASVHMPRIGTGLAGGDWAKIEALINEVLPQVPVIVYSLAE